MAKKIKPFQGEQLEIPIKEKKRRSMVRNPKKLSSDWVASGIACKQLGFEAKHLWKLRDENLLKRGEHWVNIARPNAARPTYRWHLDRIRKTLETPMEER